MMLLDAHARLLRSMMICDMTTLIVDKYHVHATSETVRDLIAMEDIGLLSQGICKQAGYPEASFTPTDLGVSHYVEHLKGLEMELKLQEELACKSRL